MNPTADGLYHSQEAMQGLNHSRLILPFMFLGLIGVRVPTCQERCLLEECGSSGVY